MSRARVRQECADLVASLEIPVPFDLEILCRSVGERRGKPILLMPTAMVFGNLCGLWLGTAKADYVFFEENTSRLHQQHIVCHELGHILRQHPVKKTLGAEIARALAPDVEPGEVQRVLGREAYSDEHEFEAELIATLVLQRVSRPRVVDTPTSLSPVANDTVARIAHSLSRGGDRA